MTNIEMLFWHYKKQITDAVQEYQKTETIKRYGFDPLEIVARYNSVVDDVGRYRWLRDNGHLDAYWSVEGPGDRCDNIDADIDSAITEDALRNLLEDQEKE